MTSIITEKGRSRICSNWRSRGAAGKKQKTNKNFLQVMDKLKYDIQ